mgnify:CR=1 FL=1
MSSQLRYGIGIAFVLFVAFLFYQGSPQAPVVTALGACVLMHLFMMGGHGAHDSEGEHKHEDATTKKSADDKHNRCH